MPLTYFLPKLIGQSSSDGLIIRLCNNNYDMKVMNVLINVGPYVFICACVQCTLDVSV